MPSRRRRLPPPDMRPAEFDMTPMIDVTFQLIVFFLVANDLSRKEIAELELPQAVHAVDDEGREEHRVILNILRPKDPANPPAVPAVAVRGRTLSTPELSRELHTKADLKRENIAGSPSEVFVLLRADRDTPWRHVQYVMQMCADPRIALHKLQFATTPRSDGESALPSKGR